jgi:hypothetical protein
VKFKLFWPIVLSLTLIGCANNTVIVPPGKAVQVRETTRVAVWVFNSVGERIPDEVDIPAGWYCLPDPGESE